VRQPGRCDIAAMDGPGQSLSKSKAINCAVGERQTDMLESGVMLLAQHHAGVLNLFSNSSLKSSSIHYPNFMHPPGSY
jgi:hypothetical protein